jgi:hypothetical protein
MDFIDEAVTGNEETFLPSIAHIARTGRSRRSLKDIAKYEGRRYRLDGEWKAFRPSGGIGHCPSWM